MTTSKDESAIVPIRTPTPREQKTWTVQRRICQSAHRKQRHGRADGAHWPVRHQRAREMWDKLESVHGSTDFSTENSNVWILLHTSRAKEGDKGGGGGGGGDEGLNFPDSFLSLVIANSLPPSWAEFADSITDSRRDPPIPSQQLISSIKNEYIRRKIEKHGIGGGAIPLHQVASSLGLKRSSTEDLHFAYCRQARMRRLQ